MGLQEIYIDVRVLRMVWVLFKIWRWTSVSLNSTIEFNFDLISSYLNVSKD